MEESQSHCELNVNFFMKQNTSDEKGVCWFIGTEGLSGGVWAETSQEGEVIIKSLGSLGTKIIK